MPCDIFEFPFQGKNLLKFPNRYKSFPVSCPPTICTCSNPKNIYITITCALYVVRYIETERLRGRGPEDRRPYGLALDCRVWFLYTLLFCAPCVRSRKLASCTNSSSGMYHLCANGVTKKTATLSTYGCLSGGCSCCASHR